ncbi:MAG TPA: glycosyltransferase family 2 protein [bacterium]|nr:glycosyltransferase family 2 protein [bacterium]
MNQITALIPTLNEEHNLLGCLESVRWADEILVVDSFSTDRTVEIAQSFGARVIQREYGSHASQRNWAIPQSSHPWVLLLDADEQCSPELHQEIRAILEKGPDYKLYKIHRWNYFLGHLQRHGDWGNDWVIRFFHRNSAIFEECGTFHGEIRITEPIGRLTNPIVHHPYVNVEEYFNKFNRYTTDAALHLLQQGKKFSTIDIVSRPLWRFIRSYFLRLGFLDGVAGFIVCALAGMYGFVKYAKLWAIDSGRKCHA